MFLSIMNTAYRLNAVRKGKQVAAARFAIDEEELRIIAKAKEDGQHLTREMAHMQVPPKIGHPPNLSLCLPGAQSTLSLSAFYHT